MSEHSQTSSGGNDKVAGFFILIAVIIAAFYFASAPAREFFLTIKMWQMTALATLIPTEQNQAILHVLQTRPATEWSSAQIANISQKINIYFFPFFLILLWFAFTHLKKYLYVVEKNRGKTYDINSLMKQEVNNVWRYLKPILGEDMLETKNPDWARAMKPQEFVMHNDLLDIPNDLMSLNEEKTKKVLALQLGELYTDMDSMPNYIKALIGCFAEHLYGSTLKATMAFMSIADSFGPTVKTGPDYSSGLALFEAHKNNPLVLQCMEKHAYIYTGTSEAFLNAKEGGIIITKYFLWLKKIDRRCYYMLNRIGRQVSWVECAGITDHFQHEYFLERPLAKIFCSAALAGIKEELKNVKLIDRNSELIAKREEINREIMKRQYSGLGV